MTKNIPLEAMMEEIIARDDKTSPVNPVTRSGKTQQAFSNACIFGPVETVVLILYEGHINVNDPVRQFWSGLQHACYSGQVEITKVLLKLGADPNYLRAKDKMDVLMAGACSPLNEEQGVFECIQLVIAAGGKVNSIQEQGFTPLIYAVKRGHEQIARILLENGANVDQADEEEKRTPINWAAVRNNKNMVKLLLDFGANASLKNKINETSYYTALNEGHKEIAKMLAFSQTSNWRPGLLENNLNAPLERKRKLMTYAGAAKGESDSTSELENQKRSQVILDQNLAAALVYLKLEKYSPILAKRKVTYNQFLNFTEKNLIDLGIYGLEDINKIIKFISDKKVSKVGCKSKVATGSSKTPCIPCSSGPGSCSKILGVVYESHSTERPKTRMEPRTSKKFSSLKKMAIFSSTIATLGIIVTLFSFRK